ncbi:sulfurtransferase [Zafaria sp. Z1313]|uniref:sulfurtransferase n=1 Tax=Zafaria sp. Z1313 TaxID=3423202 RepID=UPI003D3039B7
METFISAAGLAERLESGERIVLLDVRWALGAPDGRAAFAQGHLPGAVYVDLESELASHGTPGAGRHPLPDPAEFARAVRRWGVHDGDALVAYDAVGGLSAARAWWLLRHAGFTDVSVLDGGLRAWTEAGRPLEAGAVRPEAGNAAPGWGVMPVIDIDEAAAWPGRGVLLDARAGGRYRGEAEPVDPRRGHIPGALNLPAAECLDDAGRLLPRDVLCGRVAGLGAVGGPTAAYCGSGVTAAFLVAVLDHLGEEASLFPGSWSQWSADATREAATGTEGGAPDPRAHTTD